MSTETQTEVGTTIKLRLTPEFKEEVEAVAASLQISVSALTRMALATYVKDRLPESKADDGKEEAA